MHAARAIHKQREKREEKVRLEVRRPSAISQTSRYPRSPAVSVDTSARKSQKNEESDNLNFSYIGFIIAVFGAVPLIVGTFVEVPALWEIGLGVTLVGLFIGVVFWCTELCAEAKKFSQKKNQLSSRGKIEDSNLLQVPDRKFRNGMDSRRGSFQSDSVSLISPAVQHYTPKHHPQLTGSRNSISQYSSDFSTSSSRPNGHLIPPALILRGGRRDDGRVVSLVQPDPGLDDDSDSDAETVIEAPVSHPNNTKIIQVQSCQERQQQQYQLKKSFLGTAFNIENEKISPMAQQHRTIRMPVMPQEVDKLQRCECGRYLLTERDKLIGIRLPGIGGSSSGSGSTTKSNSPTHITSLSNPGSGSNGPPPPRNTAFRGNLGLNLEDSTNEYSTAGGGGQDVTTPQADQPPPPPPNKIISVNPSVKIAPTVPPTPQNTGSGSTAVTEVERVVDQILSSSPTNDFLKVTSARKKTENLDADFDDEEDGDVTPGNESSKTFQDAVVDEEGKDKILTELLELTDVNDEDMYEREAQEVHPTEPTSTTDESPHNDENHNRDQQLVKLSREGSRRRIQYQSQLTSITRPRPTSLPLPATTTDAEFADSSVTNDNPDVVESLLSEQNTNPTTAQSPTTMEKAENQQEDESQQITSQSDPSSKENDSTLAEDMSLDELLDSIEKKQDGEVLAVVVQ